MKHSEFKRIFNIQKLEYDELLLQIDKKLQKTPTPTMDITEVVGIGNALDEITFISIEIHHEEHDYLDSLL